MAEQDGRWHVHDRVFLYGREDWPNIHVGDPQSAHDLADYLNALERDLHAAREALAEWVEADDALRSQRLIAEAVTHMTDEEVEYEVTRRRQRLRDAEQGLRTTLAALTTAGAGEEVSQENK